jgi:hypothetical protein
MPDLDHTNYLSGIIHERQISKIKGEEKNPFFVIYKFFIKSRHAQVWPLGGLVASLFKKYL